MRPFFPWGEAVELFLNEKADRKNTQKTAAAAVTTNGDELWSLEQLSANSDCAVGEPESSKSTRRTATES